MNIFSDVVSSTFLHLKLPKDVAPTKYRVTRGKYEGAVGIIEGEKGSKVRLLFTTPFDGMVRTLGAINFGQLEELTETNDDDGGEDAEEETNQDEELIFS